MEKRTPELATRLRDARRAKGLSQAALAREAGCTQSAVSMMEMGRPDALARETLLKLALLLDVPLGAADEPATEEKTPQILSGRVCCPQAECPSNIPFAAGRTVVFWPRRQPTGHSGSYCAYCGEVLLVACPGCDAPLSEGGHCGKCGASYVNPPGDIADVSATDWAAERRRQLAEWRALL